MALQAQAKAAGLHQHIAQPRLVRHHNAAAVADRSRVYVLVGFRLSLHRTDMDAALVGKGRATHVGGVVIGGQVDHLADKAAGFGQGFQPSRGNAGITQLQLQVGNQGTEVGVAAALPIAVDRALHHRGPRRHRRHGVGHRRAAVVVGMNAQLGPGLGESLKPSVHDGHHRADLLGQGTAIGVAEYQPLGPRRDRDRQGLQRVVRVGPIAVKPVLGIVDHPAALATKVANGVVDHGQVFSQGGLQAGGHVQVPGFAKQGNPLGARREHRLQHGVFRRDLAGAAGRAKGRHLGLDQGRFLELPEKLHVLRVGPRPAPLNEGHPQGIETAGNAELIFDRQG